MPIDSANIGANFSQYSGDPNLGGGSLGVLKIDTKPLEDLARYTMLYNKAEYDQRQKNADEKILELAKLSTYDPTDSIPEERQESIDAFNEAMNAGKDYLSKLSASPLEKTKEYYDYIQRVKKATQKLDLLKARNLAYKNRMNGIEAETNIEAKEEKKRRLDEDVKRTKGGILPAEPKVDIEFPKIPEVSSNSIDFFYKDPNTNQTVTIQLPNMREITSNSALIETDFATKELDINSERFRGLSTEAKLNEIYQSRLRSAYRKNGWIASADEFNKFINTKDENGRFIYKDENGNLDREKLKSAPAMIRNTIEQFDKYNQNMRAWKKAITSNLFINKENGNPQNFDNTILFENDFDEINYNDLISAGEMARVLMLANWKPTQLRTIKAQQTNEEILIGELNYNYAKLGLEKEALDFKKIGAGWQWDGKKLVPPKGGGTTSGQLGGVVPYWQNLILPQIIENDFTKNKVITEAGEVKDISNVDNKKDKTWTPIGKEFTGDVPIRPKDISGLSMALFGEVGASGQQVGFTEDSRTSIRYRNGIPVGVVINDVFYDQNFINMKATNAENKSISNKFDRETIPEGVYQQPAGLNIPGAVKKN